MKNKNKLIDSGSELDFFARSIEGVEGYFLTINAGNRSLILPTYLSDKPRLFKRADALVKTSKGLKTHSLTFEL